MKCSICNNKIETLFLGKIKGTYFSKGKKKKAVCNICQKKLKDKDIKTTIF